MVEPQLLVRVYYSGRSVIVVGPSLSPKRRNQHSRNRANSKIQPPKHAPYFSQAPKAQRFDNGKPLLASPRRNSSASWSWRSTTSSQAPPIQLELMNCSNYYSIKLQPMQSKEQFYL
ncbi:unnamed protein product [Linum trigynum]|uniref:Uncharacterized protein n=1 Tax=Linum trigynum TaxID=586398 RepID=A0AAV2GPA3_9ROSI